MSKELKALEILYADAMIESGWVKERCITYAEEHKHNDRIKPYYELIKQALQRLEAIDNANPSEALEYLKKNSELFDEIALENPTTYKDGTVIEAYVYHCNSIGIEQALLKAQEQEKVLKSILENIELDENYAEQGSGSTKAYKLIIPNCISVDEDDDYTDDRYPNSDFETIDSFIKEIKRGN